MPRCAISTWGALVLELRAVSAFYGAAQVLWDVSLEVRRGEIVALIGSNGSGKSSVLKAVAGLLPGVTGHIRHQGRELRALPAHERAGLGIGFVLERRRLFPAMTVRENLLMGAYRVASAQAVRETLERVEALLPLVAAKRREPAGRLSGGEQQLVAIARGLMCRPSLLLLDEPFLGLSPRAVEEVAALLGHLHREGLTLLFNEQDAALCFSLAQRGYLLKAGRVVFEGHGPAALQEPAMREFLGEAVP